MQQIHTNQRNCMQLTNRIAQNCRGIYRAFGQERYKYFQSPSREFFNAASMLEKSLGD